MSENLHRAVEALCGLPEGYVTDLRPQRIAYDLRGVSLRTNNGAVTGLYPYVYAGHRDEAAAYEALASRELIPEEDPARIFTCPCWRQVAACRGCEGTGEARVPASLYQLLAWADLGRGAVATAEALAVEAAAVVRRELDAGFEFDPHFRWVFDVKGVGICWRGPDHNLWVDGRISLSDGRPLEGRLEAVAAAARMGTPLLFLDSHRAQLSFPQSEANRVRDLAPRT